MKMMLMLRNLCLWLVSVCVFTVLAWAQGKETQGGTSQPVSQQEALSLLADVLENPQQREELVRQLRRIAAEDRVALSGGKGREQSFAQSLSDEAALSAEADAVQAQQWQQVNGAIVVAKSGEDSREEAVAEADSEQAAEAQSEAKSDEKADEKEDSAQAEADALLKVTESTRAAISQAAGLPRRIANFTGELAGQMGERVKRSWQGLRDMFSGRDYRLSNLNWSVFAAALRNLGVVIGSVLAIYHGLRFLTRGLRRRLNDWSLRSEWSQFLLRKLISIGVVMMSDGLMLLIAYIAGNAIALYAVGETGRLSMQAALFMNAFVIIELLKMGLRVVFTHRFAGLRLLAADNQTVQYWYHWLATLLNLLGYGYLVAIPLIEAHLSYNLAQLASTAIAIAAFVYGVWVVIAKRKAVRQGLLAMSEKIEFPISAFFVRLLGWLWHWLALAYFVMLLVVTLLRAEKSLPFVLKGTLKTLLIVGGCALLTNLMTAYMQRGIKLPQDWQRRLPGIERQINSFVPLILRIVRIVVFVIAVLSVLGAWNLIAFEAWLNSAAGRVFVDKWLGVGLILLFTMLLWIACSAFIEHRLSPDTGRGAPSAREKTLLSLLRNALALFFCAVGLMMVLSQIGINIGPLIAGAGVLGLAVGFGAQTLVKDVITGIFIQIENAMNTGDFVMVNNISGTAEKISIRSVALRDAQGVYHLIPFSSVTTVSNYTRGYSFHVNDYGIAYNEDIDHACEVLKAAFDELAKGEYKRSILEPIAILGVSALADSSVNIRVKIKTLPGEQWVVGRAYNRLVKLYFDKAGIEMPYPHQTIYWGERKDGSAPPLRMVREQAEPRKSAAEIEAQQEQIETPDNATPPKVLQNQNAAQSIPNVDGEM